MTDQQRLLLHVIDMANDGVRLKLGEKCRLKKDRITGKQLGCLISASFNEYIIHSDTSDYDYIVVERCAPKLVRGDEEFVYR